MAGVLEVLLTASIEIVKNVTDAAVIISKEADRTALIIASALAAFALTAALIAAYAVERKSSFVRQNRLPSDDIEKESRLTEVQNEVAKQTFIYKWNSISATLLTFVQYIIGGALASS